jgi:uncharacterized protein YoxC
MLTKTEMQNILNQINEIFDDLRVRVEKLEKTMEEAAKPSSRSTTTKTTKQANN